MIWKKILLFVSITLLIGGCSFMDRSQDSNENEDDKKEDVPTDNTGTAYVPVQEYDGTGYELYNFNPKNGEIAEANREEVEKAVKKYFLEKYKVDVKIHNIVSADDAVTVFVEAVGEPHFYSYAIVPIDLKNEKVMTDKVWSQEGEVERGIRGGLYVMAFQEQFDKLDQLLGEIAEKHSLIGQSREMIENTAGDGYNTEFYSLPLGLDPMLDLYMKNPKITGEEIREYIKSVNYEFPGSTGISIRFYLSKPGIEPTDQLVKDIADEIKQMDGLPGGRYTIILNDMYIAPKDARGEKENTKRQVFEKDGEI